MSISRFPYGKAREIQKARSRKAEPAVVPAPPVESHYAAMIAELEALSRTRALSDEESAKLERAIRREKQRKARA